jgi:hypothetical protein
VARFKCPKCPRDFPTQSSATYDTPSSPLLPSLLSIILHSFSSLPSSQPQQTTNTYQKAHPHLPPHTHLPPP